MGKVRAVAARARKFAGLPVELDASQKVTLLPVIPEVESLSQESMGAVFTTGVGPRSGPLHSQVSESSPIPWSR